MTTMREDLRRERLRAMGVVLWQPRSTTRTVSSPRQVAGELSPVEAQPAGSVEEDSFGPMHDPDAQPTATRFTEPSIDVSPPPPADQNGDWASELAVDLAALRTQVSTCTRCDLHQSRKQTVFGTGDESARLLVIGEAPGADEDARGEPFVGRAGKLLNAMLMGIGLAREQVYITNILKCRPPRNRDPHADEVAHCGFFLQQQIAFVAPELILAVGRIAAQNLLGVTTSIGKLRGSTHTHTSSATPVIVTYHPAYLLRSPLEKRRAWQDLKMVAARLGIEP